MKYPEVRDEFATIAALAAGNSISRFGDGELKMIYGNGYVREKPNLKLATELFNALTIERKGHVVGVPTMNPDGPKYPNWSKHEGRFEKVLTERAGGYYSAFITRPDSAPWISSEAYMRSVVALWQGKRVGIICEPDNKLLKLARATAGNVCHQACPTKGAFKEIDGYEDWVHRKRVDLALLCCGPTATILAWRLAGRGIQALDLGSAGGFLWKLYCAHTGEAEGE